MSVIDELYEGRDEEELTVQLEEKYQNLPSSIPFAKYRRPKPAAHSASLPGSRLPMAQLPPEINWGGIRPMIWVWVKRSGAFLPGVFPEMKTEGPRRPVVYPTT